MKTLLTLILAVVCIATGSKYFFTTNNMILYEVLISAVPSFVLSLQPNTSRVKGKFIPFVISRALPGAITMALGIVTLDIINQSSLAYIFEYTSASGETLSLYEPMLILSLTFTGLVMLLRICQPLNLIRAVLYAFCAAACVTVLAIPMLGELIYEGWSQIDFNITQILLIVVLVQAALPISAGLIKFFDMFNPADDEPVSSMRYSSTAVSGNAAKYADDDEYTQNGGGISGANAGAGAQNTQSGIKNGWKNFKRRFGKKQ